MQITTAAKPQTKGLPRFLLGQSMGGAVALQVHLKQPSKWDGLVLVAPMCKVSWHISSFFFGSFCVLVSLRSNCMGYNYVIGASMSIQASKLDWLDFIKLNVFIIL